MRSDAERAEGHRPAVVEVRGLTKRFGDLTAVDDVTFDLFPGEILGILGPNGAGKTTLIQMLLHVLTPTAGRIRVFGLDLDRHREAILSRVNFSSAYVSMPSSLTVRENLQVFARLYQVSPAPERIAHLLKLLEIDGLAEKITGTLSSGQITRLCLAKALLNAPQILFLDEPTASLDPDIADKTRRLLRRLRDETGMAVVYTSHNMKEMEELCDRLLFLSKGRVLASGTPTALRDRFRGGTLEEVYLKVVRGEA